ncbi:hypothetical protein CPB83DRAFT_778169, partial [Crepidotus variabilis]
MQHDSPNSPERSKSQVLSRLLDGKITIDVRELLATLKEISHALTEAIRPKNVSQLQEMQRPREVMNTQLLITRAPPHRRLIKWQVTIQDTPVTAVIDTGSEVNLISEHIASQVIGLPLDTS